MAGPAQRFRLLRFAGGIPALVVALILEAYQGYQNIAKTPVLDAIVAGGGRALELTLVNYNIRTGIGIVTPGTSPYHTRL